MENMPKPKIKITNLVCVTYQANNYVTPYHFMGATQEEAMKKLDEWLNKPVKVQESFTEATQKDHGIAGKVWMINHSKKERLRVNASEVDKLLSEGYVTGGPRTQFKD